MMSDGEGNIKAKHAVGCFSIFFGLLVLAIIAFFYFGSLGQKEWAAARPIALSEDAWAAQREMCEIAELPAEKCGITPKAEIVQLSQKATAQIMKKLCAKDASVEAISEAKEAVRAQLKSPSSADFGGTSIQAVQDGCDWTISGQVDAQNAFGATLRSPFRVKLRRTSKEVWLPMSVRVD